MGWAAVVLAASLAAGREPPAARPPAKGPVCEPSASASAVPVPPAGTLPDLSRLARAAMPAVVGVVTTQAPPTPAHGDEGLRDLFDRLHDGARKGIGSGFFISRDGWVLTNAHVIEGADKVEVDLGGGLPRLPARVVGTDAESDVALLKVESPKPTAALPLGDSDTLDVAQWVMVIGNPFGLDHSVTVGVVSHVGRTDIAPVGRPGSYDFVQTDASINPGNSGGPLLDLSGAVVGIATAVNATGQGIGFAIPINMAKDIVDQLREHGRVVRSWLGVSVKEHPTAPGEPGAVEVTEIVAGGPAAAAGVRVGDLITGIQGHAVRTPAKLRWYVSTAGVGRQVELRVRRREGHEQALRVSLREVPAAEQARAEARAVLGE